MTDITTILKNTSPATDTAPRARVRRILDECDEEFTFDRSTADAEELALMDAAEARAINSGAW